MIFVKENIKPLAGILMFTTFVAVRLIHIQPWLWTPLH